MRQKEALLVLGIICCVVCDIPTATYHLNKYLPYNMSFISADDSQPECVYARGNFSFKHALTICYRYKAHSYAGHSKPGYLDLMQFGRKKENISDISEGYLWGNWPLGDSTSNHWIGFPEHNSPIYAWKQLPAFKDAFILNVWKHQCLSIDFVTGQFKYVLNGEQIFTTENIFEDFKADVKPFSDYFDFVSLGCAFQTTGSKVKSTVAQFTDLQIFGSTLGDDQMIEYTSCKQFLQGDLLSWEDTPWVLGGRLNISELEYPVSYTHLTLPTILLV